MDARRQPNKAAARKFQGRMNLESMQFFSNCLCAWFPYENDGDARGHF